MIQTIEKSLGRLFWRFGKGNFTPNQNDIDALTFIAKWVNREKEERINENRYFGKLVVYLYILNLRHFQDKFICEREIQEVLEKPLAFWYEQFREELNTVELRQSFDAVGIEYPYSDKNAVQAKLEANKAIFKDNEELLLQSLEGRSFNEVKTRLNIFITELLNKYGNLA